MSELNHPNEINRDYIRLLQGMGRIIKEEFSVTIRMTQEDAVEQLLHYAAESGDRGLQEMAKELKTFTYGDEEAAPASSENKPGEEGVRYYRGAPVAADSGAGGKAVEHQSEAERTPSMKSRPTRVYRGQVVNG